ncbi:MAG: dTDP-4-dehydrorhamnose 3,5-epimerase family protein [Chloroflexi bacterium]|nr:dTDP-4-dehydrorhamnose 3,5-epimerase family protein [Chloroflexota bacterium]
MPKISGIQIKQLIPHPDERGLLVELLREDDDVFSHFGQCYASLNYPGVVRAWHYHKLQDDLITAVKGMVKLVLYDGREDSPTKGAVEEFFIGEQNRVLVRIPTGVMHGYKTIGVETAIIVNFPTRAYNAAQPDEYRLPWDSEEVPYDWALKNH